jgi:hypothetical protein
MFQQRLPVTWLLGACAMLAVILAGCGGHHNSSLAPPEMTPILTGAARTLPVAAAVNGVVTDPASGLAFAFPSGASGTLTLAPITDAPARSQPGGQGYQVRFTQDAPMSLRYPVPASGEQLVYYFTDAGGCYDGIVRPQKEWLALPARTPGDGFVYFDLPQGALALTRQGVVDSVIDNVWSVTVDPPANAATLRGYVTDAKRALVAALPDPLPSAVMTRQTEHPSTVYFRDPNMTIGSFIISPAWARISTCAPTLIS